MVSLLAASEVISVRLAQQESPPAARQVVSLQLAQQAQQELLVFQAWKE
jgi:hypothetical protein